MVVHDAQQARGGGSQGGGLLRGGVGEDPRYRHAHVAVAREFGLLLRQGSLVGAGEHRLERRYDEILLPIEMAHQDVAERGGIVDQVSVGVVPERRSPLMREHPQAGTQASHGGVELDVVVLEPARVVLEVVHTFDEEGVDDVVFGPVMLMNQLHQLGKGPAECQSVLERAVRQVTQGRCQAMRVRSHRSVRPQE